MNREAHPVKMRMSGGKKRVVADRDQILSAARFIGVRNGWKAVTIRALAHELGYKPPVLYEHFRNMEDVLTHVAITGLEELNLRIRAKANPAVEPITSAVEQYWSFMLENPQLYRLINGMDGAIVDAGALRGGARNLCKATSDAIEKWLSARDGRKVNVDALTDEIWALLHGMASLFLDRGVKFTLPQVRHSALKLLVGARIVLPTSSKVLRSSANHQ